MTNHKFPGMVVLRFGNFRSHTLYDFCVFTYTATKWQGPCPYRSSEYTLGLMDFNSTVLRAGCPKSIVTGIQAISKRSLMMKR